MLLYSNPWHRAEHIVGTIYWINTSPNQQMKDQDGNDAALLNMNSRGPCRPEHLGPIFSWQSSKPSESSTFLSRQAGNVVQAICNVHLHPVALGEAKPLGSHFQHRGVNLHSVDAGLWEMIVDKEGKAAPTQAYHQQCQWSLCKKGALFTICSPESLVPALGEQKSEIVESAQGIQDLGTWPPGLILEI